MTGLAPLIVRELADTVARLANEGVAVLMAEPVLGASRRIIDRGYVLVRGGIVATIEDGGRALEDAYKTGIGLDRVKGGAPS
jgi:branched-chain amino acid transport system ATP-binding protein